MARILFINSVCYGSTGKICRDLYDTAENLGHTCCIAYGRGECPPKYNTIKVSKLLSTHLHVLKTRAIDRHGFGSNHATKKFLKEIKKYNPNIIHLHNIHGYFINVSMLFDFFKKNSNIKVIWTLHDCWPFTGHCAHFAYRGCNQWQKGCWKCEELSSYPKNFFYSNVKRNFNNKRISFTGVENLIIVTPSVWLKKKVEKSFLKSYKCIVIHNGIDLNIFKRKEFNKKKVKKNILGVANVWTERKGLNDFITLANKLESNLYDITLVGLTKKQKNKLPDNINCIEKTENISELVDIYNKADIFFNPSREDTYPTVNLEAQACGTAIITYDVCGISETLYSNQFVLVNSIDEVIFMLSKQQKLNFTKENFTIDTKMIDKNSLILEYMDLYV